MEIEQPRGRVRQGAKEGKKWECRRNGLFGGYRWAFFSPRCPNFAPFSEERVFYELTKEIPRLKDGAGLGSRSVQEGWTGERFFDNRWTGTGLGRSEGGADALRFETGLR
jgi:hypothetical protein